MRTPLCDVFGIEYPIFAFTHCRDVVAAVSKAGGLGVLGAVGFSPEQLEIELDWIDEQRERHAVRRRHGDAAEGGRRARRRTPTRCWRRSVR